MLLAVDIGNTNITLGLFEQQQLLRVFRLSSDRARTADEQAATIWQLLAMHDVARGTVDAAIIASVVPPLTELVATALRQLLGLQPLIVGPGIRTGISVQCDSPREVGADRIVNSVAAFEKHHQGLIVVDFGTATTFDCVSPTGAYLGGAIVPGIQVSLEGLVQRAAKLSKIELTVPPQAVGKNTTHALQSGVIFGYAALVDGLVGRLAAELAFPVKVVATGGLATLVSEHTTVIDEVDGDLTLTGLRILHERNRESRRRDNV